jgi:hypothetical protein
MFFTFFSFNGSYSLAQQVFLLLIRLISALANIFGVTAEKSGQELATLTPGDGKQPRTLHIYQL